MVIEEAFRPANGACILQRPSAREPTTHDQIGIRLLLAALVLGASNVAADSTNPAPSPSPNTAASKPDPMTDQGVQKLSRRGVKERIAALSQCTATSCAMWSRSSCRQK